MQLGNGRVFSKPSPRVSFMTSTTELTVLRWLAIGNWPLAIPESSLALNRFARSNRAAWLAPTDDNYLVW